MNNLKYLLFNSLAITKNTNYTHASATPKVNIRQPLNPIFISQWQSELPPSMIFDIKAVAWCQMIRLGYPLNTPLFKLLPK